MKDKLRSISIYLSIMKQSDKIPREAEMQTIIQFINNYRPSFFKGLHNEKCKNSPARSV